MPHGSLLEIASHHNPSDEWLHQGGPFTGRPLLRSARSLRGPHEDLAASSCSSNATVPLSVIARSKFSSFLGGMPSMAFAPPVDGRDPNMEAAANSPFARIGALEPEEDSMAGDGGNPFEQSPFIQMTSQADDGDPFGEADGGFLGGDADDGSPGMTISGHDSDLDGNQVMNGPMGFAGPHEEEGAMVGDDGGPQGVPGPDMPDGPIMGSPPGGMVPPGASHGANVGPMMGAGVGRSQTVEWNVPGPDGHGIQMTTDGDSNTETSHSHGDDHHSGPTHDGDKHGDHHDDSAAARQDSHGSQGSKGSSHDSNHGHGSGKEHHSDDRHGRDAEPRGRGSPEGSQDSGHAVIIVNTDGKDKSYHPVQVAGGMVAVFAQLYLWGTVFVTLFKNPRRNLESVDTVRPGAGNPQGQQRQDQPPTSPASRGQPAQTFTGASGQPGSGRPVESH